MPPSDSQNGVSVLFFFLFPPTACNLEEIGLLTPREQQVAIFAHSSS